MPLLSRCFISLFIVPRIQILGVGTDKQQTIATLMTSLYQIDFCHLERWYWTCGGSKGREGAPIRELRMPFWHHCGTSRQIQLQCALSWTCSQLNGQTHSHSWGDSHQQASYVLENQTHSWTKVLLQNFWTHLGACHSVILVSEIGSDEYAYRIPHPVCNLSTPR